MDLTRVAPIAFDLEAELVAIHPALVRRLTLVLRDHADAEDVAQTAFARALQHRDGFGAGDVRAWYYTIGLRLAFNELRRRRVRRERATDAEPTWALQTDPDLWNALAVLEPSHRAALLLNVLDGYTHDEIARMLGTRPGTVSSWISRTKDRLRTELGDDR